MPVTVELDLKEILAKINTKLDKLSDDVGLLKVGQARLEEKVDGLGKRMDGQEFLSRGILIGFLIALLGSFAKMFWFVGQ